MGSKAKLWYIIHHTSYIVLSMVFCIFLAPHSYAESGRLAAVEKMYLEGNYDAAAQEAKRLVDSGYGSNAEPYYIKGLSELKCNKFTDARRSFDEVIYKDDKSELAFDACIGIGDAFLLEGNKTGAVNTYNEIFKKFPKNRNLGLVRARIREASAATPVQTEVSMPDMMVQVGCFSSKRNADRMVTRLAQKGYIGHIELPVGAKDKLYRVKVRGATSRKKTEELALRLKRSGFSTTICAEN